MYWLLQVKKRDWQHLLAVQNAGDVFMFLGNIKDSIFSFPRHAEVSKRNFYGILDPGWGCLDDWILWCTLSLKRGSVCYFIGPTFEVSLVCPLQLRLVLFLSYINMSSSFRLIHPLWNALIPVLHIHVITITTHYYIVDNFVSLIKSFC